MEQALYRKYRPRGFQAAVAQDHIVQTLRKAIDSGRISHAYLFTGPRGVGKTSIARILAHEINGLPYKDDSIHLDIIEIDAASNRRIDEIRDLRDRVRIAPSSAKYKVYIIDEVHMLTREAFNALLKTLEEPPAHCVFILATTEAHKLPETIISRTQRYEFKPVNPAQMTEHLAGIAKKEKIDITPGALDLLAKFGEGSFRDSIGYLDQLGSRGDKITEDIVRSQLGLPSKDETEDLLVTMDSGDIQSVLQQIEKLESRGINAAELAAGLSSAIRDRITEGKSKPQDTRLLKELLEVKSSNRPRELLEIVLLESAALRPAADIWVAPNDSYPSAGAPTAKPTPSEIQKPSKKQAGSATGSFSLDNWPQVVETAKSRAASIYTALKLAQPLLNDQTLTLQFAFPLHQKKLNQAKNKALVMAIIDELFGQKVSIDCVVNKARHESTVIEPPARDVAIHSISNIFGSAEMIET